jgi:hypothetical protein
VVDMLSWIVALADVFKVRICLSHPPPLSDNF